MRIAVYGATGAIGSQIAAEAVQRGHTVTGLSRREPADRLPEGVSWRSGDASNAESVAGIAADHDVVVSALGPSRTPGEDPRGYLDTLRVLMQAVGGTRLLVVGGAGSLLAAPGTRLADTPEFPAAYKAEALTHADALELLRTAGPELDWTYFSPAPIIGPGERTGSYRLGGDEPAGEQISIPDYAVALLDELETPAHRRTRFTAAN